MPDGYGLDAGTIERLKAQNAELVGALRAIVARVNGEFDLPGLVSFGPLSTDIGVDVFDIARAAIAKAERGEG